MRRGRTWLAWLGLLLGAVLVLLLFRLFPGAWYGLSPALRAMDPWWAVLVLLTSLSHLWLTAHKWRLVVGAMHPNRERPSFGFFFYYTAMDALAAQVVPRQLSSIGIRTAALARLGFSSVGGGALIVVWDLVLDLMIPVLLLVPAMLHLAGVLGQGQALLSSLGVLLAAFLVLDCWQGKVLRWLHGGGRVVGRVLARFRQVPEEGAEGDPAAFDAGPSRAAFGLAALRYLNLVLRSFLVAKAGGLAIGLGAVAVPYPLVQLAFLANVTPAGLGVLEWSWVGVLATFGVPAAAAGAFAVLHRLAILVAVVVIALVLVLGCRLGLVQVAGRNGGSV